MWLSLTGLIALILLLILLSAFFSSAETALTAASEARMRQLVKRKSNRQAARVEALQTKREQLISTILIGNNAVNILASALATSAAIALTGDSGGGSNNGDDHYHCAVCRSAAKKLSPLIMPTSFPCVSPCQCKLLCGC